MKWYFEGLNQYFDIKGRTRRQEYWMFMLFHLLFIIVAYLLDQGLTLLINPMGINIFSLTYGLLTISPVIAASIRRLHDVGKSGWFFLLIVIPGIGPLILFVLLLMESQPKLNHWGLNPEYPDQYHLIDQIGEEVEEGNP